MSHHNGIPATGDEKAVDLDEDDLDEISGGGATGSPAPDKPQTDPPDGSRGPTWGGFDF